MIIIGLAGKKQSGKDTVYELARSQQQQIRVGRVAFADPLKAEVAVATKLDVKFIEAHKDKFRTLLQVWGADFRREIYSPDYWVDAMRGILRGAGEHVDRLFITDLRYENEAEFVHESGGFVVRVEREDTGDTHPSETVMDGYASYDHTLDNTGNLEQLEAAVAEMMEKFLPSSDGTEENKKITVMKGEE